jgi:hypothetical protein
MKEKETGVNIVADSKFSTPLVVVVEKVDLLLTLCLVSITPEIRHSPDTVQVFSELL